MKNVKLNNGAGDSVPENSGKVKAFVELKRRFETIYVSGCDYSKELMQLAQAVAYSVVKKCLDPQRKTAPERDAVSDNGQNPALLDLRHGITADVDLLDKTAYNANKATRATLDKNGDAITEVADAEAEQALAALLGETLTDGIDLVQTAALALLEQAAEHASGTEWLDRPYAIRRLSRRVYIRLGDSAAYRDDETTPIQEVYRAVRRAVQESRAVQTDPRNGYTYIEDMTVDGLDTIYYRLQKYADLGGYNVNGNYTADCQTVKDYNAITEKLNLTDRQAQVLKLRMQGKGYKAIATYLGVTQRAVAKTCEQIQKKSRDNGLFPDEN